MCPRQGTPRQLSGYPCPWIQEQIVEILGLPKLYERLLRLFEIDSFESHEILDKANTLRSLLDEYASISPQRT